MIVLALLTIGLGVLLLPSLQGLILEPAAKVVEGGVDYVKMVLGG